MKKVTAFTNDNKKGFALIEILVIVCAVIIVGLGVYLVKQSNFPLEREVPGQMTIAPTQIEDVLVLPTANPLPTLPPLNQEGTDTVVNQATQDLNQLVGELETLDQLDQNLNLPQVDFSTDL